jgi:predicted nicotinamide N-methyase
MTIKDGGTDGKENAAKSAGALASRFPTRIHQLAVAGRTIELLAPVDPDALLDDPVVEERYKADNYLPYWPIIWPSGLMLAERILTGTASPPALPAGPVCRGMRPGPMRAIELGCGLGTTGIAAGLRGWHVTFTDYDPEAVEFAGHNALRNGVPPERIRALHMDWRKPLAERFPWVLASDVLYERRLHALLLEAIEQLLEKDFGGGEAAGAEAWVSDPQRTAAEDFPIAAVERGFRVQTVNMEGESFNGGRQAGQLYILRRAAGTR